MLFPLTNQNILLQQEEITIYLPETRAVQACLQEQQNPYWARLWPAAVGMSNYLLQHPHWVRVPLVLELAAGVGLPSLIAARFAKQVICTDIEPNAIPVMQANVQLHQCTNVTCAEANWLQLPNNWQPQTILLSDVNYEPAAFTGLLQVLQQWLAAGTCMVLATPQRLMAKPFIEALLPFAIEQTEEEVVLDEQTHFISILVLKQ
jgi:predicted nicotinamide N-methyase